MSDPQPDWVLNYFNYFTEIEEHFQRARGTGLFLLSPLDWALIESWKNSGVPIEAVLRGIDKAFEKWRARKHKTQMVNSLAFCAQAVLSEAQILAGTARPSRHEAAPPFTAEDLASYLSRNASAVCGAGLEEIGAALEDLASKADSWLNDLEDLERHLTVLEEKLLATLRTRQTDEQLLAARRDLDGQLRPYRGKMSAEQLSMLERQYLERTLLETAGLPRLSLFYFR